MGVADAEAVDAELAFAGADFGVSPSTAARAIERFDLAHVVYQRFDQAEFVLRRPVTVAGEGAGARVTDYSVIQTFPARNAIVSVG